MGSRCCLVGRFLRWRIEAEYEVSEYEPCRKVAWKTVRGPLPLTFFRSTEAVDGGTKVTIGYDAEPHGLIRLLGPLAAMMGRRALAGDFPRLKELMEAHAL